ncbi:farnesyl pyrophosphate synthase-like isoform X2 [Anneissia japonica]|uniref:farnesyl pyrophosphate synthase-like isoform X2 n=1 Tax=Anneissia japonica TaxID=1529436 RepID=UPI0014258F60|nr:farnesyl pyrophosphate synthase-like isoform X2 [Anneissia japonica]
MIRNSVFTIERTVLPLLYLSLNSVTSLRCSAARPRPRPIKLKVGSRECSFHSAALTSTNRPRPVCRSHIQHKTLNAHYLTSTTKVANLLGCFNKEKFKEAFQLATEDLRGEGLKEVQDAVIQLDKMINYNVFGGKMNRAMVVLGSFNSLALPEQLTDKNQQKAVLLGWCVELDGVGLAGFNDAFLLYSSIHSILRNNFRDDPCYMYLVEIFEKVLQQTTVGQSLDLLTSPTGNTDLTRFTQERYDAIVMWKTGFYSFYMPVALALYLVGIYDDQTHNQAKEILLKMGHFFQVQDDYLDCYGDPATIGKVGTDIEENKCSWLIVQALALADQRQKKILEINYGRDDPNKVAVVKDVFKELELESLYRKFERESYANIQSDIDNLKTDLPKELFLEYAAKIYQREK